DVDPVPGRPVEIGGDGLEDEALPLEVLAATALEDVRRLPVVEEADREPLAAIRQADVGGTVRVHGAGIAGVGARRRRVGDVVTHLDPAHARAVAAVGADDHVRVLGARRRRVEEYGWGEARLQRAASEAAVGRAGLPGLVGERGRERLVAEGPAREEARHAEALRPALSDGARHGLVDARVDRDAGGILPAPAVLA